jgi:hypothetical protein
MLYRILLTTEGHTLARAEKRRSDAAMLAAETVAHDRIAAHGGLDTKRGHRAMAAVQAIDPRKGGTADVYGATLFITPSRS